jgi:peptide/nickel transport system substrate-binding protein
MFSYLRFRYRRRRRRIRRDTRVLRAWLVNYIDRHIWGKWHQVRVVRRFLLLWAVIFVVALVGLWQQIGDLSALAGISVPEPGGAYTEAAIGSVENLNPVLPESTTSEDINRLIFSGLTRYNSRGQIVPDLATWDSSSDGRTYTFHLRHGVKWHDGVPLTSTDVAFTLTAIQTPDTRSPLASSWQGVTVNTPDDYTVVFSLPQPLNSFLDSTTQGIVPRHLLESVDPSELRTADFNQHPVGTGPFEIKTFAPSAGTIELAANPHYFLGMPQLDEFDFKFFKTAAQALAAYAQHQVSSPGRIMPGPDTAAASRQPNLARYDFTLPEMQTLFFNNNDAAMSDKTLRGILSRSLNRDAIMARSTGGQGVVVDQPLLPGQLGYTKQYEPSPLNPAAARAALTTAGYNHPLHFKLITLDSPELVAAAKEIQRQYAAIGIKLDITPAGRDQLEQTYMRPRNFQMLLYGINVGADPDVYAYWHSSQSSDPGVNLSQYNSADADRALEAGRIKTDPQVRMGKYHAFLQAWDADAPAAVLYQTGYEYYTTANADGIQARHLITPADRYYAVERWTIRRHFAPLR